MSEVMVLDESGQNAVEAEDLEKEELPDEVPTRRSPGARSRTRSSSSTSWLEMERPRSPILPPRKRLRKRPRPRTARVFPARTPSSTLWPRRTTSSGATSHPWPRSRSGSRLRSRVCVGARSRGSLGASPRRPVGKDGRAERLRPRLDSPLTGGSEDHPRAARRVRLHHHRP